VSLVLRGARATPGWGPIAGALFGLVTVGGVALSQVWPTGALAMVQSIVEFLRSAGTAGPAVFTALQVLVAVVGAVPASLLGVAAGLVYGPMLGFALAALGNLLGAVIAFALSRYLLRSAIERLLARYGQLRELDASVSQDGWKLICLLRLSPVMPFSATSYLLGLSGVSFPHYLIGTLASLPALFGYVCLGTFTDAGLSAWATGASPLRWVFFGVGGIVTLLTIMHLGRRVLQQRVALQPIEQSGSPGE
jgi:uncharacterized membrane protein YdjX (TVP38/TMEM64 family)